MSGNKRGKSTIVSALLRVTNFKGRIFIDGERVISSVSITSVSIRPVVLDARVWEHAHIRQSFQAKLPRGSFMKSFSSLRASRGFFESVRESYSISMSAPQ